MNTRGRLVQITGARRIVVKIGSGVMARRGRLRRKIIAGLISDVVACRSDGCDIILVVSGAVACGYDALAFDSPPTTVIERQAAAAIGQHKLMNVLARGFARFDVEVGQLLLMQENIENRKRFLNARHSLHILLERGVVPIINENDPLTDPEANIGDNDHLAALVANVTSAELLIILSSVPGVYEDGVPGRVLSLVELDSEVQSHITEAVSETGVGGMGAKVSAAKLASRHGIPTVIASGRENGILRQIRDGAAVGTAFIPAVNRLQSRKRWIAFRTNSRGVLRVDEGARKALTRRGASLLPGGIVAVEGRFDKGDRVDIQDEGGGTFAVGLVSYAAPEIRLMKGRKPSEFPVVLGYKYVDEIVHRDDMVVLDSHTRDRELA